MQRRYTVSTRNDDPGGSTRREFGQALALAAAAPLVAGLAASPAPAQPPAPPKPDAAAAVAEALVVVLRSRHGKHLTAEQLAPVARNIASGLANADRLNQFPLKNSDEPAFAFTPDVR
jgi:hypothetical protein